MKNPPAPRASIRIDFADGGRLGPGKIALLKQIAATGSISAAARAMGMSYRKAWLLIEECNGLFSAPLVSSLAGGSGGGGAQLTPRGHAVIAAYEAIMADMDAAMGHHLKHLLP